MIGKVALAGGPKCPICGKEFKPEPPLIPNTEDREFYGGRVKRGSILLTQKTN